MQHRILNTAILYRRESDDMLLVIETPKEKDSEHWSNELPKRLKNAEVIKLI